MKSLICGTENDEKGPTETVVVVAIESSRRFRMLLSCEGEKTVRFGEPTCVKRTTGAQYITTCDTKHMKSLQPVLAACNTRL